jgi:hypothetical protein
MTALVLGLLAYSGIGGAMLRSARRGGHLFHPRFPLALLSMLFGGNQIALIAFVLLVPLGLLAFRPRTVAAVTATLTVVVVVLWLSPSDLYPRYLIWLAPLRCARGWGRGLPPAARARAGRRRRLHDAAHRRRSLDAESTAGSPSGTPHRRGPHKWQTVCLPPHSRLAAWLHARARGGHHSRPARPLRHRAERPRRPDESPLSRPTLLSPSLGTRCLDADAGLLSLHTQ